MNRSPAEVANILKVDSPQVKRWTFAFKDYLSPGANPTKGKVRLINDTDLLVLIYVAREWDNDPDVDSIKVGLNRKEHYEGAYVDSLYLHTPFIQEAPDDIDETWRHGILLVGGGQEEYLELARSYRQVAETMLRSALQEDDVAGWAYPVLFAYRHALELHLKLIGEIVERIHSLKSCVDLVEQRRNERLPSPMREWILDLEQIDPAGTAFRYAEADFGLAYEHWFDFRHFEFAMKCVFDALDIAIIRVGAKGKPAKPRMEKSMPDRKLPSTPQPDVLPESTRAVAPSLWLYGCLLALAALLICLAFRIKVDLPGLYVSLAASLIAAVVVLVFVDRRLRASEIQQIRRIPWTLGSKFLLVISARHRQIHGYVTTFEAALQSVLKDSVLRQALEALRPADGSGFVLLGDAGSGKTTLLQQLAATRAREFIDHSTQKVPVLFPLSSWPPDRTLERAIFEHMNGFSRLWQRCFVATLRKGDAIIILDGANEIFGRVPPSLSEELSAMRAAYPKVTWIVSSRSNYPTPVADLPIVNMTPLTEDEMNEIVRRLRRDK